MLVRHIIIYWSLLLLVSGCASTSSDYRFAAKHEREAYAPVATASASHPEEANAAPVPVRKTHYKGFMKVSVKNVQDAAKQASRIVEEFGGYVEQQREQDLVFRVPVQHFMKTYQRLLNLGVVLDKSIMARDITFAYQDSQSRLKIAKATLARLQVLMQKTTKDEERLQLLQEIQRVSEQVQVLEGQLQTLDGLATYSQLSMSLVPRVKTPQQSNGIQEIEGFEWIHQLSAFNRQVAQGGKRVRFATPEGMVLLDDKEQKGVWVAESADHSVFWASRLDNHPKADSAFWAEAIRKRIGGQFSQVATQEMGQKSGDDAKAYHMIRLLDHASEPYVYWLGIRADQDHLYLVEVYFPNQALEARYWESIKKSLLKGEK